MKKVFSIMSAIIMAIMFTSCNTAVKEDITKEFGAVKNLKVKELQVDTLYNYVEEFNTAFNDYVSSVDEYSIYAEEIEDAVSHLSLYNGWNHYRYKEYLEKYNTYSNLSDSIFVTLEGKKNNVDSLMQVYDTCGVIYAVKCNKINKFHVYEKTSTYAVFAYNNDGTIHRYYGNDFVEAVNSAFPETILKGWLLDVD